MKESGQRQAGPKVIEALGMRDMYHYLDFTSSVWVIGGLAGDGGGKRGPRQAVRGQAKSIWAPT
jgi:hypothetical protein